MNVSTCAFHAAPTFTEESKERKKERERKKMEVQS